MRLELYIQVAVLLAAVCAAIAYTVDRVLDATGKSRSSRTLRAENIDLVRRNEELEGKVDGLRSEVERQKAEGERQKVEMVELRALVAELQKRDQAAVLHAIEQHEASAGIRHERTLGVLESIRDLLQSTERSTR